MAENKTKATRASVDTFLDGIADEARQEDCRTLVRLMQKATKAAPKMWGTSIVGFGDMHYKYASGREGDWFLVGFAPRKDQLSLYITGCLEPHAGLLAKLGKHKRGVGCLYVKRLADIDPAVLRKLIDESIAHTQKHYLTAAQPRAKRSSASRG